MLLGREKKNNHPIPLFVTEVKEKTDYFYQHNEEEPSIQLGHLLLCLCKTQHNKTCTQMVPV